MKVATFTVHATEEQSRRWKQAAAGEGFPSAGAWLAAAADAYLKARARAGQPVPLSWRRGRVRVELEGGLTEVKGFVSHPFGAFPGNAAGRSIQCCHRFTLVYTPNGRILGTLRTYAQAKLLAAELARLWYRGGDGVEPSGNPAPVLAHTYSA